MSLLLKGREYVVAHPHEEVTPSPERREYIVTPPLKGGNVRANFLNSSPFKGEVERGMGLQLLNYQPNLLFYRFYFFKNFVVPESKNPKTSRLQFL